jgi:hypothetical protein
MTAGQESCSTGEIYKFCERLRIIADRIPHKLDNRREICAMLHAASANLVVLTAERDQLLRERKIRKGKEK